MREIKFRAYNKKQKGVFIYVDKLSFIDGNGIDEKHLDDDLVFMQYTGLKDKNGKEIYEGDILNIGNKYPEDTTDIAEVKWFRGGMMLKLVGRFGYRDIECNDKDCERHEIIGNIYENPELLTN